MASDTSHLVFISRINQGYFLVDIILKYEHFQIYSSKYFKYCSLGVSHLLSFYLFLCIIMQLWNASFLKEFLVMMLNIYLGCTDTSFGVSYPCRTCVLMISCYNFFLNCLCGLIVPVLIPMSLHPRYLYSLRELTHPCRIDLFVISLSVG